VKGPNSTMFGAQWVSKLHFGQIPKGLNVFQNWCNFVRKWAEEVGPMIDRLLGAKSRNTCSFAMAKTEVAKLLSACSLSPEEDCMWLAQQIVFDLYEIFNDEKLFGVEEAQDVEQGPGAELTFDMAINARLYCVKPADDPKKPKGRQGRKAPPRDLEYQRFLEDGLKEFESLDPLLHELSGRYVDAEGFVRNQFHHRRIGFHDIEHPHCKMGHYYKRALTHYDCSVQPEGNKPGMWPDRMPDGPFVWPRLNQIHTSIWKTYLNLSPEEIREKLPHPDCFLTQGETQPCAPKEAPAANMEQERGHPCVPDEATAANLE